MAHDGSKFGWAWKVIEVLFTVIAAVWLLASSLGRFETQSHAEDTYLKKETFDEFRKGYQDDMKDIKDMLKEIRDNQKKR